MTALKGVIAAAATPLHPDFTIDRTRLVAHCRWLLEQGGCDGVNLLGTTGEATSFSIEQRVAAMAAVAQSGLPMEQVMVGTGAASLFDAVTLTRAAHDLGFAGALLLPPFYYKGIDAEGLVRYVERVIADVDASGLKLYLYHIPQNTGVPYPFEAVEALHRRHPQTVIGLKDSSGEIAYSRRLAAALPGFAVFPSAEGTLAEAKSIGFSGCISATTNVTGRWAQVAWSSGDSTAAAKAVADAVAIRSALSAYPLMASVKAALAEMTGDGAWERCVPPLRALSPEERAALLAQLATTEFRNTQRASSQPR
jgi:4-hydroxy-tetrahydrodipicolinate synthase